MWQSNRFRQLAGTLGAATLLALSSGCYAEAGAQPAYVEAPTAPIDVEAAPQSNYDGRTVYYVQNHWYARDGARWVYYRQEPATLYRQRTHVQQAPRAPDRVGAAAQRARTREVAPRREVARPRPDAPPAVRVQ